MPDLGIARDPLDLRRALLNPQSIALVGQSDDPGKTTGRPLQYLRQGGFTGRIYPINPRRDSVLGERAYPSIDALPEVPDHAFIVLPTERVVEAVAACGAAGVKVATILADGFSEAGPEGLAREAELKAIAARTGIRLVGPSSLGVVGLRSRCLITANAAFAEPELPVGRIFVASQSGSMIGAIASRGKARGIGFAGLVSVGNETDLSIGEICAAMLDDPDVDGFLLFLESLRKAEHLRAFANAAARQGKPVVAYKLGRSAAARELALTHTGALAGEDDVASAFLADCGIARVECFEALLESMPLMRRVPLRRPGTRAPTAAVVTTTAGGAAMVVDRLGVDGIDVMTPAPATLARLAERGLSITSTRIVDLTVAGARYEVMKPALEVLTTAPEFDLVVAVAGSSARFRPDTTVRPIIECANAEKPIVAFVVPDAPEALALLQQAGVPSFRTPEACADAIVAAYGRRRPKAQPRRTRSFPSSRMLDELEAYALLDRLGIARVPAVAVNADIKQAPDLLFRYPVAVKVLSAAVFHKTDAGGVVLGVPDRAALPAAIATIRENVRRAGATVDRVLVGQMAVGLGEALIGYRVDPDAGPIVLVAAGGIATEIVRDRSLRLAPVDLATAREMIGEVRALKLLSGYRGKPAGDLDALALAIVALSQLATRDEPVLEIDINPLIVREAGAGVIAVDALARMGEGE